MKHTTTLALAAALTVAFARPGAAQVRGIPVYNSGVATGITLAAEFGKPNDASGGGVAYGASGRLGLGRMGVTAMAVESDLKGPGGKFLSVGATLNLKLLGGPLIPLSATLQGGAGYSKNSVVAQPMGTTGQVTEMRFPVGLGIAMTLPNPVLAIKPWLAPRIDIIRATTQGASATSTAFGISGGLEFNFLSGLGIHAAYDWSRRNGVTLGTLGLGLHYGLRVPGL